MLTLSAILKFINGHLKPIEGGEQIIKAGYIIKFGETKDEEWKDDEDGFTSRKKTITALCLQQCDLKGPPHKMVIEISVPEKPEQDCRILTSTCTCVGGQNGKCKHCTAILLMLSKTNRNKEIEKWTCTDLECNWNKVSQTVASQMLIPKAMKDFCHFKKKPENLCFPQDVDEMSEEFNIILRGFPDSAFVKDSCGRGTEPRSLQQAVIVAEIPDIVSPLFSLECTAADVIEDLMVLSSRDQSEINFYNDNIAITEAMAKDIYSKTTKQNDVTWHKFRQIRITGSIAHSYFTYFSNKNPDWQQKLTKTVFPTFKGCGSTRYGKKFEPVALEIYNRGLSTGRIIKHVGFFINKDIPWIGYSADGLLVTDGPNTAPVGDGSPELNTQSLVLLEVKCPVQGKKTNDLYELLKTLKYLNWTKKNGYELKKRHMYNTQIQLGMLLFNLKAAKLLIFWKKRESVLEVDVSFDPEYCARLINTLREVYFPIILPFLYVNEKSLLLSVYK